MSAPTFAQWTAPTPKIGDVVLNDTCYLYNVDANAFFLGANSWNTRASVSTKKGYKCVIEHAEGMSDEIVTIKDSVETKGGMFYVFASSQSDLWVDYNNNGSINWQFDKQSDGTYLIYNAGLTDHETYPLGIDLTQSNKTELYLNNPESESTTVQNRWGIVMPADYDEYFVAYTLYENAMTLGSKIEEAENYGIDVTDAKSVYDNTASSNDQIVAAIDAVNTLINKYKENLASPENPQDITENYIPDADFELNQGAGVWQRTHSAQNYQTGGTPGKMGDDTYFLEAWHPSTFTGKTYVSIADIPNGVYQFTLSAATNGGDGCYVYANNDSVEVTTGSTMTPYTVYTLVTDNNLEVGLNLPKSQQNWIGIDDAKLTYFGNTNESYAYWLKSAIENAPEYDNYSLVQKALVEKYNEIISADLSSMSKDEILAQIEKFNAIKDELSENAKAYAAYKELMEAADELRNSGYSGDEADELYDYLEETAESIINEKTYSTEEINNESQSLSEKIEIVKTNCLAEDMDCTNLLTNPNFNNRTTGWSYDTNYADGAWGGLSSNPCVERWNDNFNFYQTVTGVPNGVYELSVQAFYRPSGSTTTSYNDYIANPENNDDIIAYIYANSSEQKIANIASHTYSENLENNCEQVADGIYVPNGMNSASAAFTRGDYENTVRGVVTDGTLTVGIKQLNGTVAGRWTLWDNFRLTYKAMDFDAITNMIENYNEKIDEISNSTLEEKLLSELDNAHNAAYNATDGKEAFDALVSLINIINECQNSITAYDKVLEAISNYDEIYGNSTNEAVKEEAKTIANEIQDMYSNKSLTTEGAYEAIDKLTYICAKLRLPNNYTEATDENPVDFTSVIINNSFEGANSNETGSTTGWTYSTGANDVGAKDITNETYVITNGDGDYVFNIWASSSTFDYYVYQNILALPAGTYELKALLASDKNNTISLSANGVSADFTTENEKNVATEGSVIFTVEENDTVEIRAYSSSWFKADNFTLTYYGTNSEKVSTAVDNLNNTEKATVAAIYNAAGVQVKELVKGINIVKMSDNTVKKIFVK